MYFVFLFIIFVNWIVVWLIFLLFSVLKVVFLKSCSLDKILLDLRIVVNFVVDVLF